MVWSRFFAPCMLPLAPGYLSYVTGLTGTNLTAAGNASTGATRTATRPSSRTPGAGGGRAGAVRGRVHRRVHPARLRRRAVRPHAAGARPRHPRHRRSVDCRARPRVAGVLPGLSRTWRISRLPKAGLAGAPLLGATFALSWTPCLSPTLTAVLGLAAVQGSAARGTLLAAAYSLGMGLPFIGFGAGLPRLLHLSRFVRRHGGVGHPPRRCPTRRRRPGPGHPAYGPSSSTGFGPPSAPARSASNPERGIGGEPRRRAPHRRAPRQRAPAPRSRTQSPAGRGTGAEESP
jgi:cytochrome c-type biogenesis protein